MNASEAFDPDEVLSFEEWCELNNISKSTGRRIIDSGEGPTLTWMSPRRMGVTRGNNRAWQKKRSEKLAAA